MMHLIRLAVISIVLLASANGLQKGPKDLCTDCQAQMQGLLDLIISGGTRDEAIAKYVEICINFFQQPPLASEGLAERNVDIIIYIVREKLSTTSPVTAEAMCFFNDLCPNTDPNYDWTLNLDFVGPKPTPDIPQLPIDGQPTMEVLQITDIHIDPTYTPGNDALCGFYSCCRASQGPAPNSTAAAGYWGDYRGCDMPVHALQNLLDQAAANHPNIAYVMFTGDVIDHANWERTTELNIEHFTLVMNMLRQAFPNVPILPAFGNHESVPANRAPPSEWNVPSNLKNEWLFQLAADFWGQWLPGTADTIIRGGFYAYEINPGLKVITLNNNFCYTSNWWLAYDNVDPAGQWAWLAQELLLAEQAGQKVHILAHIPPGSSTAWDVCHREYRRIIDRFQNIVKAQFHGHTHNDHFSIYYDVEDPSRATTLSFTGGSATAYRNYNPNYRIYQVDGPYDGASYQILDHTTWFYNLTEANEAGPDVSPNWQILYSFKDAYGVESMLPQDLDALAIRMAQDVSLQEQYYRFYVKAGDPSLEKGCDQACLQKIVCNIVKTVNTDDCSRLPF